MAKFEIPKDGGKSRHTRAPKGERESEKCEDGNEQMYRHLEQEVKEAEPGTTKESTTKEATDVKAKAMKQKPEAVEVEAHAAPAAAFVATAAADGQTITKTHAEAAEGADASEVQETTEKEGKIRALIHERRTMAKHEKERIREISKEIKKHIRENKRTKRHERIQKILEKVKGTRNIPSIKSVKRRILIPKVKDKEGEIIKTRQGIANVFA